MRRTMLVWLPPAMVVAFAWLRLEEPSSGGPRVPILLALALAPALLARPLARGVAAASATLAAGAIAFDVSPLAARPGHDERLLGSIGDRLDAGLRGFYDVGLPLDPNVHAEMHGLVLIAVFVFALGLSLSVRARRPLVGCAVLAGGAGWPATLLGGPGELTRGALILAGSLFLLAALQASRRGLRPAVVATAAVVLAAVAASSTSAVARGGILEWQGWDPYVGSQRVSVDYVWRSQYGGIRFPKKATTVFEVEASNEPRYWRATTLDAFGEDVWDERLDPLVAVPAGNRDELSTDLTLPPQAADERNWLRQRVTIKALADEHLPAAATPVAYAAPSDDVVYHAGGVARVSDGVRRGTTYTVWSYSSKPAPRRLARQQAENPPGIGFSDQYLSVWYDYAPALFGTPNRDAQVQNLMRAVPQIARYQPLYATARRVVGGATTPYAAAVALETWLRRAGGFAYDEQPPSTPGVPALVGFVTQTKSGYCQQFAGAMALMLRYLGIPARVAAGFTSGDYDTDRDRWIVSDTNAHAWVEVWFPRYGWLPFDPTPARGTLDAPYTNASPRFDANGAATVLAASGALGLEALQRLGREQRQREAGDAVPRDLPGAGPASEDGDEGRVGGGLVLLLAVACVLLLAAVKSGRRRARYLTSDPRRLATACRAELVELAADQRVLFSHEATATELAEHLRARLGVDAERFAVAVAAARFGPPAQAEAAARRARRELAALKRALRSSLTATERLRGFLSLRSLRPSG
ncbi:MAG: transglutaminaseTgpA domain-containing protein [Gaiellaceae bacterium]